MPKIGEASTVHDHTVRQASTPEAPQESEQEMTRTADRIEVPASTWPENVTSFRGSFADGD